MELQYVLNVRPVPMLMLHRRIVTHELLERLVLLVFHREPNVQVAPILILDKLVEILEQLER
jgi:hypothetical protein